MKDFFYKTFTLMFFIFAVALFYTAISVTYSSVFINLVLIIMSIFVLIHACGRVDKTLHFGSHQIKNNDDNQSNNEH